MLLRRYWLSLGVLGLFMLTGLAMLYAQSRDQAVAGSVPAMVVGGRYQYFDGPVPTVFDTQTGKAYRWFPRDEKEKKDPYLFVMDFVSGSGSTVEIQWPKKSAK